MSTEPQDQRFARLVLEAFAEAGRHTDALVGQADGPSTSTMTKLRAVAKGETTMREPREPTWSKIERATGWPKGFARQVWGGAEPSSAEDRVVHDLLWLSPVFDRFSNERRELLLDWMELLSQSAENRRADLVVRTVEGDTVALEVKTGGQTVANDDRESFEDAAQALMVTRPDIDSVVVHTASQAKGDGYLMFRRVQAPEIRAWRDRRNRFFHGSPPPADLRDHDALEGWLAEDDKPAAAAHDDENLSIDAEAEALGDDST